MAYSRMGFSNTIILSKSLCISLIALSLSINSYAGEPLDKGFTLKMAYISPLGNWGNISSIPMHYQMTEPRWGFGLQLGTMFFPEAFKLSEEMSFGIDVTWISMNAQSSKFVWIKDYQTPTERFGEFNLYHFYFYPEVGPMFSIAPIEKMAIDLSVKFSPGFTIAAGSYPLDGGNEAIGGIGYAFRYTPSFYFRYDVLLVGMEFNIGDAQMSYEGGAFVGTVKETTPYSAARVVVGFKF